MNTHELNLQKDPIVNGHVIEASAGTGKTYSVAALVVRELAEHEELRIGNILITTFTRAAAGELRDRVRKRIAATADQLGLRRHLLYNWRSELRLGGDKAFPGHGNATSLEAENATLRRALAEAQQERDILKKATAFFAKHTL